MLNKFNRKPILVAGGILVLLALGYFVLPGLLAQRFASAMNKVSGLAFTSQSSRFEFSPPGLAFGQAKLSNKAGQILLEAETLNVPFSALASGSGAAIRFENAAMHGYAADGREHFSVTKIYGSSTLNSDGSLAASGSGDVGNVHVTAEITLASLARALSEGSPVDFNLISNSAKVSYSGRLKLQDGFDVAGTMSLETADVRAFFNAVGPGVSILQQGWPLNFTAAVETRDNMLSFSNIEGQLGGMKGLGNATYSAPGGKPKLTLDLGMDVIDLSLFGLGTPSREGPWREKPFDLAGIDSLDAIWHISSNALRFGPTEVGPGQFDGSLKDRILEASYVTKDAREFNAHFGVDAQGFQPALEVSLAAAKLDGKSALASFTGFDWLTGTTSVSAKLSTSGDSPAAMVSKLSGNLDVQLAQGQISGVEAASLLQAAMSQPVDGWNGGVTENVEAQASLNFTDGIGTVQQGSFAAPNVSGKLSGDIDLLRQALELKIVPGFANGIKTTAPVAANGPWDTPKFMPDKSP